jgi:hypothetical protein
LIGRRSGSKFVAYCPRDAKVLRLAAFGGKLYLSTDRGVYVLRGCLFVPFRC